MGRRRSSVGSTVDSFAQSLGLVVESDTLSLSTGLRVQNNMLIDNANGARHLLHPKASSVVAVLQSPIRYSEWCLVIRKYALKDNELFEIISFLDSIGGLRVERSKVVAFGILIRRCAFRIRGIKLPNPAHRFSSTPKSLLTALFLASFPLLLIVLALCALSLGLPEYKTVIGGNVITLFTVLFSTYIHEFVHIAIANSSSAVVLQRGLRLGVLHAELSRSRELLSAILGPLAGILAAGLIGQFFALLNMDNMQWFAYIVMLFHVVSWLPTYGDGMAVLKNVRRQIDAATT